VRELDFEPIKSKEQFLENYNKHDVAMDVFKNYCRKFPGLFVFPYGEDSRNKKVWAQGNDKPDLRAYFKPTKNTSLIDVKGHTNRNFMINKRAYDSYINWGNKLHHRVFIIWVLINEGLMFWNELPFSDFIIDVMPHDGNTVVKVKSFVNPISELPLF